MDDLQRTLNISLLLSTQLRLNKSEMMLVILYFTNNIEFKAQDTE